MDAHLLSHPTDQTLSSYGLGKLDDGSVDAIHQHLEQCPDCRKRVAEMSADSFLGRIRDAQKSASQPTFSPSRPSGKRNDGGVNDPAPPPASALPPGLADHPDYEIKQELGRGGMGVVYLAHNTLMGRDEVLKVMGQQIMDRPGVLERFLREIRAVARLRHPNIVTAYHATRLGESIIFAMEYVDGVDLARWVKANGPLPVRDACHFVYQAALGLQHAHEEGLVHRDIKPGNLMLSHKKDNSTVKILDFGLAKVTREEKVDGALTSEGQALGTPDFIAPEQILDAMSADIRADIYSLGSTLYYLLTGRPPFQANSLYDIYQAHISQDVNPLNFVRTEVPTELAVLVAKMMAKDPVRRFQTPAEAAQALVPFFKKGDVGSKMEVSQARRPEGKRSMIDWSSAQAVVVPPRRRPPWMWPAIVAASVLGLITLGVIIITIRGKNGEIKITASDDQSFKVETPDAVVEHNPSGESAPSTTRSITTATAPGDHPGTSPTAKPLTAITNSIGMKLVLIPTGEFLMGSPDDDKDAEYYEKPLHRVRITKRFYLGGCEVTQAQYEEVMGVNPSFFSSNRGGKNRIAEQPSTDCPVENVSWLDAVRFCNKLSEKEDLKPFYAIEGQKVRIPDQSGTGYRLPTEAEWEFACRAGGTARYYFGDEPKFIGRYGWFQDNSGGRTHPVGLLTPNDFGLYDMLGNVWEWCGDAFALYAKGKDQLTINPFIIDNSNGHVFRGMAYPHAARLMRNAARCPNLTTFRARDVGFRVARSPR